MRCLMPLLACALLTAAETPPVPIAGNVVWSAIGNSLDARGAMRDAEWVQNMVDELEVSADGTLFAGCYWDEQGRCIGLYQDGHTNRQLVGQYDRKGGHNCWGYGTANAALAVDGTRFYCINTDKQLLRFDWSAGNLDSHRYRDQVEVGKEAIALGARDGVLVAVYRDGTVERRLDADLATIAVSTTVADATDVAVAADGTVWLVVGTRVAEYDQSLQPTGRSLPDPGRPTSVHVAPDGRVVTTDSAAQVVRIYRDLRLERTVGQPGGYQAGTPGAPAPDKFSGLRGATFDAAGNLYVALCLAPGPDGNTILRSFTADGTLRWELACHHFSECVALETAGPHLRAVGKTVNMLIDPTARTWAVEAHTYDPAVGEDVDRLHRCGVHLRTIGGQRFTFIDQMTGDHGFSIFRQPAGVGMATRVGTLGGDVGDTWSWHLDANGNLWSAVAQDRSIRRLPVGEVVNGAPTWNEANTTQQPWPEGWGEICRLHYDEAADALYIAGYPSGEAPKSWGLIGSALARYDGWRHGTPTRRWLNHDLPLDNEGFPPKSMTVCGDYAFIVSTRERRDCRAVVEVLACATGASLGALIPPREVGLTAGWIDIRTALNALRTDDGRYHLVIEDNCSGRQHFVTWTPPRN